MNILVAFIGGFVVGMLVCFVIVAWTFLKK